MPKGPSPRCSAFPASDVETINFAVYKSLETEAVVIQRYCCILQCDAVHCMHWCVELSLLLGFKLHGLALHASVCAQGQTQDEQGMLAWAYACVRLQSLYGHNKHCVGCLLILYVPLFVE